MNASTGASRRWRSHSQLLADRAKVANLYLRGEAIHSIAATMNLTPKAVVSDLRVIRAEWRDSAMFDFGLARQQELARIDMIEAEAWRAWDNSKSPLEMTNTRQRRRDLSFQNTGQGDSRMPIDSISEAYKRSTMRDPNPAFLERIAWCVEMRCKILGLLAPQELRHSGNVAQITEIHYQPSAIESAAGGRLVILGGPPPALPTPTPEDVSGDRPDSPEAYAAPDLAPEAESGEDDEPGYEEPQEPQEVEEEG